MVKSEPYSQKSQNGVRLIRGPYQGGTARRGRACTAEKGIWREKSIVMKERAGVACETLTGSLHCDKPRGPGDGERETGGWPTWQRAGTDIDGQSRSRNTFPGGRPPVRAPGLCHAGRALFLLRPIVNYAFACSALSSCNSRPPTFLMASPITPQSRVRRVLKHIGNMFPGENPSSLISR